MIILITTNVVDIEWKTKKYKWILHLYYDFIPYKKTKKSPVQTHRAFQ